MLDHLGIEVSDNAASRAFYERALAPLGMAVLMEPVPNFCGFGPTEGLRKPYFWIGTRAGTPHANVHVAFAAESREQVDAFHAAALEGGGTDNGGPGVREIYHPHYYGAFVLDLDGNNVEAVCHTPG